MKGADQTVAGDRIFRFVDKNHDGKVDRAEWEAFIKSSTGPLGEHGILAIISGGHGDVTATNVAWKEPRGVPEIPMPLWFNNRVYAVTNGGTVSCMDAKTGKIVFRARLGSPGAYFSSPVAAGGRIYLASYEGILSVISGGGQLEVLAKNDLGEPIFATPAFAGNVIYVRTPTTIYAFSN